MGLPYWQKTVGVMMRTPSLWSFLIVDSRNQV